MIRKLGGTVAEVAPGKSTINPLDWSVLRSAADRIADVAWVEDLKHPDGGQTGAEIAELLRGLAFDQATTLVLALCRLVRGRGLEDLEETLVSVGVRAVHDQVEGAQLIDLVQLLENPRGHSDLLAATVMASTANMSIRNLASASAAMASAAPYSSIASMVRSSGNKPSAYARLIAAIVVVASRTTSPRASKRAHIGAGLSGTTSSPVWSL